MNIQKLWVFGLSPSYGILKKSTRFGNWICFRLQVRRETPALFGPLERFSDWNSLSLRLSPPSPEDGKRSSFRNVVFSSFSDYRTVDKVQNPVILCVTYHHQNPLESKNEPPNQCSIIYCWVPHSERLKHLRATAHRDENALFCTKNLVKVA
jgi:hypothetical protein